MGRAIARFWGIAVAAIMPVVLIAGGAGAIVGGTVDGEGHPNVGFVVELDNGEPLDGCTGTLMSESVVVTAAHCLADRLAYTVSSMKRPISAPANSG